MPVIKDAILVYAKLKTPVLEYKEKPDPDNKFMNKEYTTQALITPEFYKKLKSSYKGIKAIDNIMRCSPSEFEEKFKIEAPESYQNGEGELLIMILCRKAYYNDGNENPAPQIVGIVNQRQDREGNDVTNCDLGNGTVAHLQFKERSWDNEWGKGSKLDLSAVCVTKLVKYVKPDNIEFDFEEGEDGGFGDDASDGFGQDGGFESDSASESGSSTGSETNTATKTDVSW